MSTQPRRFERTQVTTLADALGILELKRSTVSVAEGIRQNLDNQKKEFIQPFFSTVQWMMAGNDTEGVR
jgi:type I restriction enzyme R subunit